MYIKQYILLDCILLIFTMSYSLLTFINAISVTDRLRSAAGCVRIVITPLGKLLQVLTLALFVFYSDSPFILPFLALNLSDFSVNSNAANVCSPIEHIVPNWNAIPTSADIGSKEGNVVNSVLATPVVASNVKTSQPINNSSIKAVMSSKTTAKVSSFGMC